MSAVEFERVRLGVGLLVMLGCLGVGFGVHDLYPFSSFSMYAGVPYTATSRVVAITDSRVTDPQDLIDWRCEEELPDTAGECSDHGTFYRLRYRDVDAFRWVRRHSGDGVTPVLLARRIWTLGPPGQPPTHTDCDIAQCHASTAP